METPHSQLDRRAVIDVGTNSVKLLVADMNRGEVCPVFEDGRQTRLGEGFYAERRLHPEAIRRTAEVIRDYARQAEVLKAGSLQVIATSAAREAVNANEFLGAVQALTGLQVQVLTGREEATRAYRGVASAGHQGPLLVMDVGGGSTEWIMGEGGEPFLIESAAIGTVRLLSRHSVSDPPTPAEWKACWSDVTGFLESRLVPAMDRVRGGGGKPYRLVATGGTPAILGCLWGGWDRIERSRLEGLVLTLEQVRDLRLRLWEAPIERRREFPGLPPERADVILFGVVIFEATLTVLGQSALAISLRGLRYGSLLGAD